ncbi:MAG TPA: hypothetical protein VGM39_15225 [Kofleriaceae bacterium]|jgi:hypothetical protein
MFNEILTGKATLEPKPPMGGPYREPEVPNESRRCAHCRQAFAVPVTSHAHTCVTCQLAAAQAASLPVNYNSYPAPQRDYTFLYLRIALAVMGLIAAAVGGWR